jgi:WD40 repeat protein
MSRVVRSSKFRHVFGTPEKKELCYEGLKPSRSAWDSNKVAASGQFIACIWDAGGGGAFCVLDIENKGKLGQIPVVAGHAGDVLDIEFNPFHDNIIASCSEDGYAKIWKIPEGGLKENMTTPVQSLQGHKRKVGTVNFNPIANNVLATTSTDFSVRVWDIETGQTKIDVPGHADIIQSAGWNITGQYLATASKDKKLRIVDPRASSIVAEAEAHQGVKGMRVTYLGNKEKLFSMGFSKTSERQFSIWDPKNLSKPIHATNVDTASGIIMPFYDDDTTCLFLAGKGDGNIRYYEIVDEEPYCHFLSEYKSATPQRGMAIVPKTSLDFASCEIVRLLKLTGTGVEPIHFNVPRKSDVFQDDLYPDTFSGEPTLTADEYFHGKNGTQKKRAITPGFIAPKKAEPEFKASAVEPAGPKTEKELRTEYEKLTKRVAYLEAELVKRDARIKELEGK